MAGTSRHAKVCTRVQLMHVWSFPKPKEKRQKRSFAASEIPCIPISLFSFDLNSFPWHEIYWFSKMNFALHAFKLWYDKYRQFVTQGHVGITNTKCLALFLNHFGLYFVLFIFWCRLDVLVFPVFILLLVCVSLLSWVSPRYMVIFFLFLYYFSVIYMLFV